LGLGCEGGVDTGFAVIMSEVGILGVGVGVVNFFPVIERFIDYFIIIPTARVKGELV
jgi:hypothetical protein